MPSLTKRNKANAAILAKYEGPQSAENAIKAIKSFKHPKFDQTVEVVASLGIDVKAADQAIRGAISMPRGVGKTARVIAFCSEDKVAAAKAAGAVEAGGETLVQKVSGGWMEFDVAVASPDMMRVVSPLGRVLGPKGLMPSPKAGTVTPDIITAVKEFAAGKVEFRNDDGGNVHCVIGKMSFPEAHLAENFMHFLQTIERMKPSTAKGTYIRKLVISGTMTPGIQITA